MHLKSLLYLPYLAIYNCAETSDNIGTVSLLHNAFAQCMLSSDFSYFVHTANTHA